MNKGYRSIFLILLTLGFLSQVAHSQLAGKRIFTLSTVVRVRQIEVTRDSALGPDESSVHTAAEARVFRETIERSWPGAKITWAFSWLALNDERPQYLELKKLIVSYHHLYGDEITFIPGAYFSNMYNTREQVNRDLHDGLQLVSELVGDGYRPLSVIAGFLSAENLRYLAEEEDIHVCQGNIWSQYAIDNGDGEGSISYPYYPSLEHFCKPARGKEDFIDCVNLDGWTIDFVNATYPGAKFIEGERCGSRQGVGPIETVIRLGTERGIKSMLSCTAAHFDQGFELNNFGWITCIWELSLVEARKIYGYKGRNGMEGMEIWLSEIRKRWPDAQLITQGEFGMLWREQFKNNDALNYRFAQKGSGICGSEEQLEVKWYMNKDFRLAFQRNWKENTPYEIIDFTRYDLKAEEPADPEPGGHSRNWSLINRLNQKGIRPQDVPIDIGELNAEEQALIKKWYPELITAKSNLTPLDLRCEYLANPDGIDITQPRLSWKLQSAESAQKQKAYQILVASSQDKLNNNIGDLWDSGQVNSDQTIQIPYKGKALISEMHCYWKVRSWDNENQASPWSQAARWSMGLLEKSDWKAQWIGFDSIPMPEDISSMPVRNFKHEPNAVPKFKEYLPSPHLRKEFTIEKEILHAALYVSAQGHVEMHLNGQRVSNEYFTPGWTDYNKRIYYRTHVVTAMLKKGPNAIGAILGDGWFRGNISILGQNQYGEKLRLLSQLKIDYTDGTSEIIASDRSWKAAFGPIILSDMFEGETYDARKEINGWNAPNFDDYDWKAVALGSDIDPLIQAYPGVPVRPIQELPTLALTEPLPASYVFDLGQNFSGWARLKVTGQAGDTVHLQFAEMLQADGTVYDDNLRSAQAADNYILKGAAEEIYEPHFTFHGFRYVQVTGLSQKPNLETITGIVIHSDAPLTSSFECSNPMLNQLHSNVVWGQRSNYLEIPTDCPQRDERLGWTGDTQVFMKSGCYNQDVSAFFSKWIIDLMDTQNEAGTFGQQAPVFHGHGSPAWADAGIICPWTQYEMYGDQRIIDTNYEAMARFIESCRTHGLTGRGGGFGDWLAIGSETPKELISAAYFGYTTSLLAKMAEALGKEDDAKKYRELFETIRQNFQDQFVKADGTIAGHSQTGYCLALHYNLLTDQQRMQAAAHLVERIKTKNYHLSVGFVGVSILLPTLTEIGRSDLAYQLIQNNSYPSWGYSIEQGATTIWERWNSYTKKDGFGDVGMNSFNHYAYGACSEWMFQSILGIATDGPGFKKIIMKPQIGGGLTWAKGHYDSIHGRISSDWKITDGYLHWKVSVPANTQATVHIPTLNKDGAIIRILESGDYYLTQKLSK